MASARVSCPKRLPSRLLNIGSLFSCGFQPNVFRAVARMSDNLQSSAAETSVQQFVRLLTGNERRLKSYILTLVPNLADAEQIAQDTSLRLWEQFDRYNPA